MLEWISSRNSGPICIDTNAYLLDNADTILVDGPDQGLHDIDVSMFGKTCIEDMSNVGN